MSGGVRVRHWSPWDHNNPWERYGRQKYVRVCQDAGRCSIDTPVPPRNEVSDFFLEVRVLEHVDKGLSHALTTTKKST